MSATNSTPIINLPLFIGTDKPAWLTDWNGAMNTIDTAIANLQTAESGTATSLASLAQSVEALSGTVSQHTTAIQTVTTATAGNTGSINTINSLIGNGEPTTEDKTIIGAINEIYAEIGGGTGVDAEDVVYSNTSSGLTATNVQAAIDEVNAKIPASGSVDADDVAYDNQTSGLTATDVQAAIDELAQGNDVNIVAPETKIGTFLGKDLYRKVVTASSPTHLGVIDATLTAAYVDDLVNMYGYFNTATNKLPLNYANVPSGAPAGTTSVSAQISTTGLLTAIEGIAVTNVVVIIEYTKA